MNITIPYGQGSYICQIPDSTNILSIKEPNLQLTPALFTAAVARYLNTKPFDLSNTVVIVADKTRVCDYPIYLPLLVEQLRHHGMKQGDLRFIIAYGTHPRQSDGECRTCYGDIYNRFPFLHHDCEDPDIFVDCGITKRGTPIRLRQDIYTAGCLIAMGPICHHYFAGYGGGRKLIFPGCGEMKAIYANHGLYLDRERCRLSCGCQPGRLKDNPLAEDLFEIEEARRADMAIHGIMNSHGQLSDIHIGSGKSTFLEACAMHGDLCEKRAPTYSLIIASCGGFPKDINFIQSHKAIHNSAMFVEDGGTLIIYSACLDGIGSTTFLPWFETMDFETAFAQLGLEYQGNGGTALAMMTKTRRIRIVMVTELADQLCFTIGVEKWNHSKVETFLSQNSLPLAYIPNASLLVRKRL